MSLQYLIDANIFITASRTYYDFDFGNSFWDFLVEQGKKEIIASIDKVFNELKKGDDKLKEWATKDFLNYFIDTTSDNVLEQYAILMQWANNQRNQYSPNAIEEFMKEINADAWLISLALTDIDKYVIVTFEKENYQIKRKIPIPNVCKAFNIKYCDLFQMLKNLNFKF